MKVMNLLSGIFFFILEEPVLSESLGGGPYLFISTNCKYSLACTDNLTSVYKNLPQYFFLFMW